MITAPRRAGVVLAVLTVALTTVAASDGEHLDAASEVTAITRPDDPVILAGSQLGPRLLGTAVDRVVAFRWTGGAFDAVPVQVDERVEVAFSEVRRLYRADLESVTSLLYVDQQTGATGTEFDDDPTLDPNDQVVLMARDAGQLKPAGAVPPAVRATSGLKLTIRDPLFAGSVGYLYLYASTAAQPPVQETTGVTYDFELTGIDDYDDYGFTRPRTYDNNLERSLVRTPSYSTLFSNRWLRDELRIGPGARPDLIDREKVLFGPGDCRRTVTTFNYTGGGAFVANKVGPVRAIRSYLGANSGIITQRDHFFYDGREQVVTNLRVHEIPGVLSLLDLAAPARGMDYVSRTNTGVTGVETVDGRPGSRPQDNPALDWDMFTGDQGSIIRSSRVFTDIAVPAGAEPVAGEGIRVRSYYEDDDGSDGTQPTDRCDDESAGGFPLPRDDADGDALGTSGIWIQPQPPAPPGKLEDRLPCTDPLRDVGRPGNPYPDCDRRWDLRLTTNLSYEAPGVAVTPADAQLITDRATTALQTTVAAAS